MKKEKERLVVGMMLLLLFWLIKATTGRETIPDLPSMAKPGCNDTCGGVTIPYPFGIGLNCSANRTFTVTCSNNSRPFLNSINLEVLQIRLETSTILVNGPVVTTSDFPMGPYLNFSATPFSLSHHRNVFIGIGCDSVAQLMDATESEIVGCISMCSSSNATTSIGSGSGSGCYGTNCCHSLLPPESSGNEVYTVSLSSSNTSPLSTSNKNTSGCNYVFLALEQWVFNPTEPAQEGWFYNLSNLTDPFAVEARWQNVPLLLDWKPDEKCKFCDPRGMIGCDQYGAYCSCYDISVGNPYLPNGCQAFNECHNSTMCGVNMICIKDQIFGGRICRYQPKSKTVMFVVVGIGSGLGGLLLITGAWWSRKLIKRRMKAKLKKKFFKRNGGLLLQQQLTSAEQGYVEKTKVFTSKELEKATDGYNEDRILGHGGQGTVYKGMLTDGKIVAIKKSIIVDEANLDEFINEVVILSQINHRNVVKLHGCCLETQVPMLVYDFIPNGTLFQYIHHQQNEDFPLSWDVRLRIASEVAEALSYLHSAASQPIYHRDVKSTNILLDEKYRAKVADFGASRSTAIDQTHMTTRVLGTFGYLDPEYFQSSQFTAKSDVYSFGVVLLELLTGQKAVLPIAFEEGRSLATYFMFSMEENRLLDILDAQVLEEGGKDEIQGVANLAKRCLNLNGKKRPTMKEVVMELEAIRISPRSSHPTDQEHYEEVDTHSHSFVEQELTSPSIKSCLEDKPLLFN